MGDMSYDAEKMRDLLRIRRETPQDAAPSEKIAVNQKIIDYLDLFPSMARMWETVYLKEKGERIIREQKEMLKAPKNAAPSRTHAAGQPPTLF
jgi:hypothetical protein